MKHILEAVIWNHYRSKKPRGFYNIIKGHTGVDLNYIFEPLPSPVTGQIVKILEQKEMGKVIYLCDIASGSIHVFAHMKQVDVTEGQKVKRNQVLGITGNSGAKTTSAHLHYEIIVFKKPEKLLDRIMARSLATYKGWNTDPIMYLRELYGKYGFGPSGDLIT